MLIGNKRNHLSFVSKMTNLLKNIGMGACLALFGCGNQTEMPENSTSHPQVLLPISSYLNRLSLVGTPEFALPLPQFTTGSLCTPLDPNFLEYRYPEHIAYCKRNVSFETKVKIGAWYGVTPDNFKEYEFDHYIPLSIGGSDNDDNLWPQLRDANNALNKDKLEYDLFIEISNGSISQIKAEEAIKNWRPIQISATSP